MQKRILATFLSLAAALIGLGDGAFAQDGPAETAQSAGDAPKGSLNESEARRERLAKIDSLITDLGSPRFAEREAAERELSEVGALARVPLERALQSSDAEIVARSRRLLAALPKLTHVIVDALNQPIPWATVTVDVIVQNNSEQFTSQSMKYESDELGRIPVPPLPSSDYKAVVQVAHADYGIGRCEVASHSRENVLCFPLVRAGTEARRRAVEGVVLAADNQQSVKGAVVECRHVRTPGQGLVNPTNPLGVAISDSEGRFCLYLPNENRDRERGELIPLHSNYLLTVTAADEETLFPTSGMFSSDEINSINLRRAEHFHRFRFEAIGGGWIDDPRHLQGITVVYDGDDQAGSGQVALHKRVVTKGRLLLPGKYTATGYFNGPSVKFEPVVVTSDSPEQLDFRLPPAVVYRGRVVHGVTGESLPGAFVMGWSSTSRQNLALLSNEQWSHLDEVDSNPPDDDHPAMKLLREHYGVQELVRTDQDGRFEITQAPDDDFYGLIAFGKDFVPLRVRTYSLESGLDRAAEAGEFSLFPASKVLVRPVHNGERISVSPKWLLADSDQPDWIDRFHAAVNEQGREFEYVHWLRLNEAQPLFVPSGVRLRMSFECPYDDEWAPTEMEMPIQLPQAETLDLGDLHFTAALPATVRVVGQGGQPLEGIPVRRKYTKGDAWSVAHNTDAQGEAYFHVIPNSQGQFRATIVGGREADKEENVTFEFDVSDKRPVEPFEIVITEEQLQRFREQGAEKQ